MYQYLYRRKKKKIKKIKKNNNNNDDKTFIDGEDLTESLNNTIAAAVIIM